MGLHLPHVHGGRTARRRERVATRLEQAARSPGAPAAVRASTPRILLIAAVLRSELPLPVDGLATVRALTRDRHGPLYADVEGVDLLDDLRDVEQELGMRGSHRRAARAIAAGEVAVPRPSPVTPRRPPTRRR